MLGKRAVVITIDPAKRLKTSLGIETLGNHATDLTHRFTGEDQLAGEFSAIVPDGQKTFDELLETLSPSETFQARMKNNPIYSMMTQEFSGSNAYVALQKLEAVYSSNQFDTIILDTPPNRNLSAFLEAPKLLSRLYEEKLIRWLVVPTNRIFSSGVKHALSIMEKLAGSNFMTHLIDFASGLFEIQFQYYQMLKKMDHLLTSDEVSFLLVTTPDPNIVSDLTALTQTLNEKNFSFEGVILNRSVAFFDTIPDETLRDMSAEQREGVLLIEQVRKKEGQLISELDDVIPGQNWLRGLLPEFSRDIHSLEGLYAVAKTLG